MATAATPVRPFVVDLADLRADALALAGGKAANLGELIAGGFAVPAGFCVTTEAYERVAPVPGATPADARAALLAVDVPPEVAEAVGAAYAALGPGVAVAVRSSATAEDLPDASFAGQQDTVLHVVGMQNVLDAVRRCWASLWSERAVSYRARNGIPDESVRAAVVVQRMVDAEVAGVLFTADPVSGCRSRSVIDAARGLGESVVSGAVDPDHVVVNTAEPAARTGEASHGTGEPAHVVDYRVGDQQVEIRPRPGGGTRRVMTGGAREPCLTPERVAELVATGRKVEAHFGAPQDIEWALDGAGVLWLTQARPITTLHPIPEGRLGPGLRAYFCASLAQGLTRPLTPMGVSAFRVMTAGVAREAFDVAVPDPTLGPPAFAEAAGRVFTDITPALRHPVGRRLLPAVLDVMEARSGPLVRRLCEEPEFAAVAGSRLRFGVRVGRVALRYRVPALVALALARPPAARARVALAGARLRAALEAGADRGGSGAARLDRVEALLGTAFPTMFRVAPVAAAGFLALGLARWAAGPDLDADAVHAVLRGLPHNSTTEMDLQLWALATRVGADAEAREVLLRHPAAELAARHRAGNLPPALQRGLGDYLSRYGHRAVAEIDVGVPRWSDDPAYVLGVLANYLRLDDPSAAPDAHFARAARAAEAAVRGVVARARRRSRWRARAIAVLLGRVRALAGMREEHKDLLMRLLAHVRVELAELGRGLAERGLLADPADVFFLDLRELRTALAGADHQAVVAARRATHVRELRRRHVPRILLSDGTEPEALAAPADGAGLRGTPASTGTVTAPARVVLDPVGAHLEPGEVLVVPSTDPGWTPLFLTAGALVMEMGGANSHGAVVAREYGIPAVVGVPGATRRIHTGEVVTVEGGAGLVRPQAGAPREQRAGSREQSVGPLSVDRGTAGSSL